MHTSPLAGAARLKGLIGAGDIKAGVLSATLEPLQTAECTPPPCACARRVPALAVLADTMRHYSKW